MIIMTYKEALFRDKIYSEFQKEVEDMTREIKEIDEKLQCWDDLFSEERRRLVIRQRLLLKKCNNVMQECSYFESLLW